MIDPILDLKAAYFDRLLRRVALSENTLEYASHFNRVVYRTLALREGMKMEIATGDLDKDLLNEYKQLIEELNHILEIGITP